MRFAGKCQATVPQWLQAKFEKMEDKPEDARKIAEDILTAQVLDLAAHGVEHIHFYTLNKSDITAQVCTALGYK
jgi:methylenetetrahydrofolate reductase (NADPH)